MELMFWLLVTAAALPAAAPTMDVMGLTMGAPLSAVECPVAKSYGAPRYESEYSSKNLTRPCYEVRSNYTDQPGSKIDVGVVEVRLLLGDTVPKGVKWDSIEGTLIDGQLHVLKVPTRGISSQESLLQQLVDKYGAPFDQSREAVRTRAGVEYEAAYATWGFGNLLVTFIGMAGSIDHGGISFATAKGHAHEAAESAARKAKEPKL